MNNNNNNNNNNTENRMDKVNSKFLFIRQKADQIQNIGARKNTQIRINANNKDGQNRTEHDINISLQN